MKIQLVEDDPILARTLSLNLQLEGYTVVHQPTLHEAISSIQLGQLPQLVILDLGLTDGSGFDFLEFIKQNKIVVPVLILSAQSDEDSIVKGLLAGAKDFVKKPYGLKELLARVKVVLRENKNDSSELVEFEKLSVNKMTRIAMYENQVLDLNRREFDILEYFIRNAERIVSREQLLQFLDKDLEIFDRTIDSHISHIRKSFKKLNLKTLKISSVYGLGYRLEKGADV